MSALAPVRRAGGAAAVAAASAGLFWSGYLTVVGAAAARALSVASAPPASQTASLDRRRFRILVPAHDEERTVATTVSSLVALEYSADCVEVHVVADNCTDRTAVVARDAGATVHERVDPLRPGKGPALAWLIDRLPPGADNDVVVVIDADSVMAAGSLAAFDAALGGGHAAVQGLYLVRDADSGGAVGFRAAALAVRHLVRPAGRTALGGSSSLYGNGMAFREDVARAHGWSSHLTEDLEMGLRLLLAGHTVGFARDALVEAEMPKLLDDAVSQNERWEAGRLDVARRFVPDLVRAAWRRDHGRRWPYLDAAIDISLPPLSTVGMATIAGGLGSVVFARGRARAWGAAAAATAVALFTVHLVGSLRVAGAPPEVRRSLLRAPGHALWKARVVGRVTRRTPDSWVRTTRNEPG